MKNKNKFVNFIISKLIIFSVLVFVFFNVTSCSTKEIVIEKVPEKKEVTKIVIKNKEKLDIVETIVQDNNIVISIEDYKKIIINYRILNDYNNYLLDIIKYYENNL